MNISDVENRIRKPNGKLKTTSIIIEGENGTFLGVTRKDDHTKWSFIGGKCEEGESPITCCCRELEEETGLIANHVDLVDVRDYDNHAVNPPRPEEVWLYKVTKYTGTPYTDEEAKAKGEGLVGWVTPEQLLEGAFDDYNKEILEEYYGWISSK
jgi:8-oxo-dGTP pyrophosphatase MutT (NUDIX family)